MKKLNRSILSLLFPAIGILLFFIIYKNTNLQTIRESMHSLHPLWLLLTIPLTLGAVLLRALRWELQLHPLGYRSGIGPLILAVFQLYLANLFIPRSGELLRCGIVTRSSGISFVTVAGTVAAERLCDLAAFACIAAITVAWQLPFFLAVLHTLSLPHTVPFLIPALLLIAGTALLIVILRFRQLRAALAAVITRFSRGFSSVLTTGAPVRFILLSFTIQFLWIATIPLLFRAFAPTAHLSLTHALLLFTAGTMAVLLPVQAGIGIWHGIATVTLLQFGIDEQNSRLFALFTHTFTCSVNLLLGVAGYLLIPVVKIPRHTPDLTTSPAES